MSLHRTQGAPYYAWVAKGDGPDDAVVDEARLANRIYDVWRRSSRRYGAPRVTAALGRHGRFDGGQQLHRADGHCGLAVDVHDATGAAGRSPGP